MTARVHKVLTRTKLAAYLSDHTAFRHNATRLTGSIPTVMGTEIEPQSDNYSSRSVVTVLARKWPIVLGTGILFGVAGLVYSLLMTPIYQASTTLYITSGTSVVPAVFDAVKASQERMPSYAHLAYSDAVLEPAIKAAGLTMTVDQARSALRVNPNPQFVLFNLDARDPNPDIAVRLANAVADSLVDAVARLEVPGAGGESTAKLSVVSTATVDTSPVEPKTLLNVALPSVVGIALALLAVIVGERMNKTVRDERDVEHAIGVPVVATIDAQAADDSKGPGSVLADFAAADDPVATQYRHIRSVLAETRHHQGTGIVMVASARTRERTTRVALNIAAAYTQLGSSAVVVNTNFQHSSLVELSGCANKVGLTDVLADKCDPADAVEMTADPLFPDLKVLNLGHSQSPTNPVDLLSSKRFLEVIAALSSAFDLVIMDSPAMLENTAASNLVHAADIVMVVAQSKVTRISDLEACQEEIADAGGSIEGVILTRKR